MSEGDKGAGNVQGTPGKILSAAASMPSADFAVEAETRPKPIVYPSPAIKEARDDTGGASDVVQNEDAENEDGSGGSTASLNRTSVYNHSEINGSYSFIEDAQSSLTRETKSHHERENITDSVQRNNVLEAVDATDFNRLSFLSTRPGGFQNSTLRKRVWPVLLSMDETKPAENSQAESITTTLVESESSAPENNENDDTESHRDENQVRLDTDRAFTVFPEGLDEDEKLALKEDLRQIIVNVLRKYPPLWYFQGYHDITSIFLLVFEDKRLTTRAVEKFSLHHIRDSMQKGLDPVVGYLRLFRRLIHKTDPDLAAVVDGTETLPYFALPWVITLMSHDLTQFDVICRIFDVLLAKNPAFIAYLGAAVLILSRDIILSMDPEFLADPTIVHALLSKLPEITLDPQHSRKAQQDKEEEEYLDGIFLEDDCENEKINEQVEIELETGSLVDSALSSDFGDNVRGTLRPLYVEDLITTALELFERYPLFHNDGKDGLGTKEVMGPRSAVFSWEKSISDEEAVKFAKEGIEIVVPLSQEEKDTKDGRGPKKDKTTIESSSTDTPSSESHVHVKKNLPEISTLGVVLTVVGVAGVVMAVMYNSSSIDSKKTWAGLRSFWSH